MNKERDDWEEFWEGDADSHDWHVPDMDEDRLPSAEELDAVLHLKSKYGYNADTMGRIQFTKRSQELKVELLRYEDQWTLTLVDKRNGLDVMAALDREGLQELHDKLASALQEAGIPRAHPTS